MARDTRPGTLLLPGSLPQNAATLSALCAGLPRLSDVAVRLADARMGGTCEGSWSDVERDALHCDGDLTDGAALASRCVDTVDSPGTQKFGVATPLCAALGMTDLSVMDPVSAALSVEESRALCAAADLHMRDEGVRLYFLDMHRWLVTSGRNIEVLTERPEYLVGEALRTNLPRGNEGRLVERWMNELQMLLFTHPVNTAREDRGLPPINVVWLWGLGAGTAATSQRAPTSPPCDVVFAFSQAIGNGDSPAWQSAWATLAPQILSADTIILGDTQPRIRLQRAQPSTLSRLFAHFKAKPTLENVLTSLHAKSLS